MPDETDANKILTTAPCRTGDTTRTPSYYVDEDYPARKTWNPITSAWMKQLTWLSIVHSGDWCLRLALHTPSDGRQERRQKLMAADFINQMSLTS